MNPSRESVVGGVAVLAVAAIVGGVLGCGGSGGNPTNTQYANSVANLKALDLGLLQYVADWDDIFPPTRTWMDATMPYVRNAAIYRSPLVPIPGYGYALNSDVAGHAGTEFASPDTTITLFDSQDLTRNATAATSTLPAPPRYGTKNTISYMSGRVQDEPGSVNPDLYEESRTRLKALTLGAVIYMNDYDDFAPMANTWADGLGPYVKNSDDFRSPIVQKKNPADYGYALNSAVAGVSQGSIDSPATTTFFFDSTVLTRNATAPTSTLPNPPRYGANNTISFFDGHVH